MRSTPFAAASRILKSVKCTIIDVVQVDVQKSVPAIYELKCLIYLSMTVDRLHMVTALQCYKC